MTISDPANWEQPGWHKGPKYNKILEMIAELNTPTATPADHASEHHTGGGDLLAHDSIPGGASGNPHSGDLNAKALSGTDWVQKVAAPRLYGQHTNSVTNIIAGDLGIYYTATGVGYIMMTISPPMWLERWVAIYSKTITAKSVIVRWYNSSSADYITQTRIWWGDANGSTVTLLLNDTADYGDGSTGMRADPFDFTDHSMSAGDWISILVQVQQLIVSTCRIKSLDFTWGIS